MAPIDRREHRQQRLRGAGPSSVQTSFGFNFGALGAPAAKQSALPPRPSSRRTPTQSTPRNLNGSSRRHRSASVQRSSNSKRRPTPKHHAVTPQLGKRKRGSPDAQPASDDGEEDELSPDREDTDRSIEKSRRVIGTIQPIHEELDEAPDELSFLAASEKIPRTSLANTSAVVNGTPVSVLANRRISSNGVQQKTPIAGRIGAMSVTSRQSLPRRSKSADPRPITPGMLPDRRPRPSATRFGSDFNTPRENQAEEESEDELSPPQMNGATPRVISTGLPAQQIVEESDVIDVDELSSPVQPLSVQKTAQPQDKPQTQTRKPVTHKSRPIVIEEGIAAVPEALVQPKRGRPSKSSNVKEAEIKATPVGRKPEKRRLPPRVLENDDDEEIDELSPETNRTTQQSGRGKSGAKEIVHVSDAEEQDELEESQLDQGQVMETLPTVRRQPSKEPQRAKTSTEKPPRKRQKFSGPKQAISVMRIKGSEVRGITVADTTRTILEENIDHRLNRMVEKMQTSRDSSTRKELRSEINLCLSFKESLDEKLLDLQDANDVLSINFKKMKLFKRDNIDLRREILALQNSRQEIALEHDEVQAAFEAKKEKIDTRNKLSQNMFDIEAAIQSGRERARKEGREDEGPEIPLSMLLESVGRNVGSFGGGLLDNIKKFNGVLERAAGWLEGRA